MTPPQPRTLASHVARYLASLGALSAEEAKESPLPRLALMSLFAIALLAARVVCTHSTAYKFLAWNLFLAWIPFALGLAVERFVAARAHSALVAAAALAWLLFLPNAPYIVTDLIHIRFRQEAPLWFDAVMLMAFAWTGLTLGVASLRRLAGVVASRWGLGLARVFVVTVAGLSGYGIYLGRFARLNSWDLAAHPGWAARELLEPVAHPVAMAQAWNVTLTQAALFLMIYLTDQGRTFGPPAPRSRPE
ncbi:MAG: DUF1361 domain-containing protein [Myxococcales bacterium]|jgi:uncharacterized membrane protein|nr:DUF1361 domain-containing protein [Myxococcales bacterium]MBL0194056.1 DUF1361 domain-containing protein [Myxococcales bacterium]